MHRWRGGVDDVGAVGGEGVAAAGGREGEGGDVACSVFDGSAVEGEGGGGLVVEVGGGVAVLNGVGEGEGVVARSRGIGGVLVGGTGFEGELGRTTGGGDGDGF